MHNSTRQLQVLKSLDKAAPAKIWAEQWDDLKTMWHNGMPLEAISENLGRTVSAVLTQATRLGLPRRQAPGRKARTPEVTVRKTATIDYHSNIIAFQSRDDMAQAAAAPRHEKKARHCLMCSTSFTSLGSHNRICPRCKTGSAYQIGHDDTYRVLSA